MTVRQALSRSHAILFRIIEGLERAQSWPEGPARSEIRALLLVVLPALKRHEELVSMAFAGVPAETELGAEHRRIAELRIQIVSVLEHPDQVWERYRDHLTALAFRMRRHLAEAEMNLWPRYRMRARTARELQFARRLMKAVRDFERAVEDCRRITRDYVPTMATLH